MHCLESHPSCTACDLHLQAKTVGIAGIGDTSPHVLFVYSAPNLTENVSGRAFRSKDGLVLTRIAQHKLPNCGTAFTFAVRCYSTQAGKKQKPNATQFKACYSHLKEEIRDLKPTVIVPVGKIPCNALGVKGQMEQLAGQPTTLEIEGRTYKVVPMLDPAHIRARPALRSTWEAHWDVLAHVVKEGDGTDYLKAAKGELVSAISLAYLMRTHPHPLGLDLETTGLSPEQGSILTVAVATEDRALGAEIRSPFDVACLRDGLLSRSAQRPLIVHGSRFEESWFRRFLGVQMPEDSIIDTVLLSKRAFPGQPASLAALTARLLPELSGFKADTGEGISNPLSLRPRDLLVRNVIDAAVLPTLHRMLMEIWATRCSAYAKQVAQDVG